MRHDLDEALELLIRPGEFHDVALQLLLGPFAFRDVLVGSQNADDAARGARQRDFVAARPALPTVRTGHGLFVADLRHTGFHHMAIIRRVEVGRIAPVGEVVNGLAEDVRRRGHAGVVRKGFVTAQIASLAVLPEDSLRDMVQDQLEHLSRPDEILLRASQVA